MSITDLGREGKFGCQTRISCQPFLLQDYLVHNSYNVYDLYLCLRNHVNTKEICELGNCLGWLFGEQSNNVWRDIQGLRFFMFHLMTWFELPYSSLKSGSQRTSVDPWDGKQCWTLPTVSTEDQSQKTSSPKHKHNYYAHCKNANKQYIVKQSLCTIQHALKRSRLNTSVAR